MSHQPLKLKQRQEIKRLLTNKMLAKYGEVPGLERELETFLAQESMTEASLRHLDQRVQRKVEQAKSVARTPSQHSVPSQHSRVPGSSQGSSKSSHKSSSCVPEDDDNEWAAIMRYDAEQFLEEERAKKRRLEENQLKLRRELDRQMQDKERRRQQEKEDTRQYEAAMTVNLHLAEQREHEKEKEQHEKIQFEKTLRDQQLRDELRRKRNQEKAQKEHDSKLVNRMHTELQEEQKRLDQRKQQERGYMQKIMRDNQQHKQQQRTILSREKHEDVQVMEAYARMLDQQEDDRLLALKARDEKQQQLHATMADSILKQQLKRNAEEDLLLLRQIQAKEAATQAEDQRQLILQKQQKADIREFLDKQSLAKQRRKEENHRDFNQQAEMWKRDSEDFYSMEGHKKARDKQLNLLHAQALQLQIREKQNKQQKRTMNTQELSLNKELLKKVRNN